MEQEKNLKDVLIAKDGKTGEIGVVTGQKEDGTPKISTKPGQGQDFLRLDRNGDVLDNFFTNFFRQYKEPKHFGFYRVAADGVENTLEVLKDLLKNPEENKELLAPHRVDTEEYEQKVKQEPAQEQQETHQGESGKKEYQPIDGNSINWQELEEKWGVNRQSLEESGDLKKMLNYGKSGLVTVSPKFGDERFETEARLSFRPQPDGSVRLVPHLIRKEPQLEKEFKGYAFSAEDKNNLKKSGNMGRVAQLKNRDTGEITSAFISIDRLTNNLVAVPVDKVRIPEKIGNTLLTEQDKQELRAGHPVPNKEIELASGKKFTTTLQVNAEQKGVEFVPRNSQLKHGNAREQQEGQQPSKNYRFQWQDENGNIRAPKTFGGVELTPEQQSDFTVGKTILVKDMVRDKQGKPFTAYIKFNHEEGKPKYFRTDPDVSQAQQVAPASESRTQVAVNSDGKTNEATKHIGEPLRQGQTSPDNSKQQQRQNKPKGVSI
jgi:hypothetical protein